MTDLNATEFSDFFEAVHGYKPHAWQRRLAQQVISEGKWPKAVDMPTGTGKTSLLDIAIFALAVKPDIFPRRVFFVIDRRIVVDQVSLRAQTIADAIAKTLKSAKKAKDAKSVLVRVSERLSEIAGGDLLDDETPLGVAALRGGIPLDRKWTQRPDQPWVITTTVDQFGSRLLFRGYGTSRAARPVNAGLCGNDCLIILDEIHLARPFAQTLRDVTSSDDFDGIVSIGKESGLPRRLQIVEMSATSPAETRDDEATFKYTEEDLSGNTLFAQIVNAQKQIIPVETKGGREVHKWFPKTVLGLLKGVHAHERSVGIIVNRVQTAREIHTALKGKGYDSVLLTGRMRPLDKLAQFNTAKKRTDPERGGSEFDELDKPLVTVATQTIEVGADFSFDALISEVAPIDSLVQRLGRLNRRGAALGEDDRPARCWVVGSENVLKNPDFVYGEAARETWEVLLQLASDDQFGVDEVNVDDDETSVPAGSLELDIGSFPAEAFAPYTEAPILLPTHVEAWVQTNPQPNVEPEVAPFLHGMKDPDARPQREVSLIWRHDRSQLALEQVVPSPAEMLTVPLYAAISWLKNHEEVAISDIETSVSPEEKKRATTDSQDEEKPRHITVWRQRDESRVHRFLISEANKIVPGDVLVIPPEWGGAADGTWDPTPRPDESLAKQDSEEVPSEDAGAETDNEVPIVVAAEPARIQDLGDAAQWAGLKQCTLRLDPRLFAGFQAAFPSLPRPAEEDDSEVSAKERITEWLNGAAESLKSAVVKEEFTWLQEVVVHLAGGGWRHSTIDSSEDHSNHYYLLRKGIEPDEGRWSETGAGTLLEDHLKGVGELAAESAKRLGLPDDLVADFRLAGELHDIGKVDSRFQMQMVGQDRIAYAGLPGPLAKSLPGVRTTRYGWPPVRHEISSLALIESNDAAALSLANDEDLVLHLVSSHHGHSRPIPPIRPDDEPVDMEFEYRQNGKVMPMQASTDLANTPLSVEIIERFWRLHKKYGHHGLAWLEAIFRLADQRRSMLETRGQTQGVSSK